MTLTKEERVIAVVAVAGFLIGLAAPFFCQRGQPAPADTQTQKPSAAIADRRAPGEITDPVTRVGRCHEHVLGEMFRVDTVDGSFRIAATIVTPGSPPAICYYIDGEPSCQEAITAPEIP